MRLNLEDTQLPMEEEIRAWKKDNYKAQLFKLMYTNFVN